MEVWRVNEYDWVVGKSWEEIKKYYLEITGLPDEDAIDPHMCHKCTEMEMKNTVGLFDIEDQNSGKVTLWEVFQGHQSDEPAVIWMME